MFLLQTLHLVLGLSVQTRATDARLLWLWSSASLMISCSCHQRCLFCEGHLSEKRTRLIAGSTDVEQGAVRVWKTMQRSKTNLVLPFSLMSTFKIRKLSRSSDVVHLQTVYIHKNNIQIMAVDFYIDLVCVMDFIFIWQLYWTFETSSKLLD